MILVDIYKENGMDTVRKLIMDDIEMNTKIDVRCGMEEHTATLF